MAITYAGGSSLPAVGSTAYKTAQTSSPTPGAVGSASNPIYLSPQQVISMGGGYVNNNPQTAINAQRAYEALPVSARTIPATAIGAMAPGIATGQFTPLNMPQQPTYTNPGIVNTAGLTTTQPNTKTSVPTFTRNADGQIVMTQSADINAQDEASRIINENIATRIGLAPQRENILQSPEIIAQQNEVQRQRQQVNEYTAQLNSVISKQNQDLLQLRGTGSKEGVTEAVYGGQAATINREAAIKALPLQAAVSAAQGNLSLAQDYLQQVTALKTEAVNNEYNYKVAVYNAVSEGASKMEQVRLDQLKTNATNARDDKLNNISSQEKWAQLAAQYGQSSLIPQIQALNPESPTFRTQLGAITGTLVDKNAALDVQYKQAQIQNAKLQGDKLRQEIKSSQPVTGEYAPVINGAAGLVANVKKEQVKLNISTALANGNFNNAYAEIANAVSDGLTGTPKTKFDDARTDVGIMIGMRKAIQDYTSAGGDMNLLKGTEEEIKRKLGITSGKASALATQLWREFQTYRSNMTGAAFTPQESRDYAAVNPTLGKSLDLNLNVIDGALNQLTTRITSTVNARIPEAQKIYDLANTSQTTTTNQAPAIDRSNIDINGLNVTLPDGTIWSAPTQDALNKFKIKYGL